MPRYRATQDYRAVYRGRLVAYIKGAEVEIDDAAEAEWVNRDSPGTLVDATKREPEGSRGSGRRRGPSS